LHGATLADSKVNQIEIVRSGERLEKTYAWTTHGR